LELTRLSFWELGDGNWPQLCSVFRRGFSRRWLAYSYRWQWATAGEKWCCQVNPVSMQLSSTNGWLCDSCPHIHFLYFSAVQALFSLTSTWHCHWIYTVCCKSWLNFVIPY